MLSNTLPCRAGVGIARAVAVPCTMPCELSGGPNPGYVRQQTTAFALNGGPLSAIAHKVTSQTQKNVPR